MKGTTSSSTCPAILTSRSERCPSHRTCITSTGICPTSGRPVLIQALTGFVDAGIAGRLAREQLLTSLEGQVDRHLRRRPAARLPLPPPGDDLRRGPLGELRRAGAGAAPAARRRRTPRSCCSPAPSRTCSGSGSPPRSSTLVERLGVRLTVGLNAIPMAVPHTRPTGVTAHATRRELIAGYEPWLQRVQVPGSAGHLLEFRLGQRGPRRDGLRRARAALPGPDRVPGRRRAAADRGVRRRPACCCRRDELRAAAELVRAEIDQQIAQTDEAASRGARPWSSSTTRSSAAAGEQPAGRAQPARCPPPTSWAPSWSGSWPSSRARTIRPEPDLRRSPAGAPVSRVPGSSYPYRLWQKRRWAGRPALAGAPGVGGPCPRVG